MSFAENSVTTSAAPGPNQPFLHRSLAVPTATTTTIAESYSFLENATSTANPLALNPAQPSSSVAENSELTAHSSTTKIVQSLGASSANDNGKSMLEKPRKRLATTEIPPPRKVRLSKSILHHNKAHTPISTEKNDRVLR